MPRTTTLEHRHARPRMDGPDATITRTAHRLAALLAAVVVAVAGCAGATGDAPSGSPSHAEPSGAAPSGAASSGIASSPTTGITVFAAGDIAGCGFDGSQKTAALIVDRPGHVLTLGDNAYEEGTDAQFRDCYDPTWGRFRDRTWPAPGNHDYRTPGAAGYFRYFGARAGDPGRGYYVVELGSWRLYSLNSDCDAIGGCGPGSPQETWLRADLAAHPADCILAYWHHARFSSGSAHGSDPRTDAFWRDLQAAGADVALAGHDHDYERFMPQDANGRPDPLGIRAFVVGTGGSGLRPFGAVLPTSEVRDAATHGVLELTLRPGGYDWRFLPIAGRTFTDAGSGTCTPAPPL